MAGTEAGVYIGSRRFLVFQQSVNGGRVWSVTALHTAREGIGTDAMMSEQRLVLIPKRLQDVTDQDIWDFVNNLWVEEQEIDFTESDRQHLWNRLAGFGIIDSRAAYYKQAYIRPMTRAVHYVFERTRRPKVLDICCGTGTQSILFALFGAEVVGIDHDPQQLEVMRKRITYYQGLCGEFGPIHVIQGDVRGTPLDEYGAFDSMYSHGGVGHFLTADEILGFYKPYLKPGGYLILKNPNVQCISGKLLGHVLGRSSVSDYRAAARKHGYCPRALRGTTAFPRAAWIAGDLTHIPDFLLRQIPWLSIHLEIVMQRLG